MRLLFWYIIASLSMPVVLFSLLRVAPIRKVLEEQGNLDVVEQMERDGLVSFLVIAVCWPYFVWIFIAHWIFE